MTYEPKTYRKDGGDTIVVASGGKVEVEAGGTIQQGAVAAGAALTLTRALHDGKIVLLDTAAGSTCTLPAATGSGAVFRFVVSVTPTSNAHVVEVANATDVMAGTAFGTDDEGEPANGWATASTSDTITMDSSTTGGEIGDSVECIDIAAGTWAVSARLTQTGTEATPFSAAVS